MQVKNTILADAMQEHPEDFFSDYNPESEGDDE